MSNGHEIVVWKCRLGRRIHWFTCESNLDSFVKRTRDDGRYPADAGYVRIDRHKRALVKFLNDNERSDR